MKTTQLQTYYSKNKKLNALLCDIEEDLRYLGLEEVEHYKKSFPREIDFNIVQYGSMLCYYSDVRKFYINHGYKSAEKWSDERLWETYKRQVGYVARQL